MELYKMHGTQDTQICPFSKSKFSLYWAWSLTESTLLHRLVQSIELGTVQTGLERLTRFGNANVLRLPVKKLRLQYLLTIILEKVLKRGKATPPHIDPWFAHLILVTMIWDQLGLWCTLVNQSIVNQCIMNLNLSIK